MKLSKRKLVLIVVASVSLAVILAVTIAFAILTSGQVLSLGGVRVSDEMYAFWQAYNRRKYIVDAAHEGYDVSDTEMFWQSEYEPGVTHDMHCADLTRTYVARIAAAAYLFDAMGGTLNDREKKQAIQQLDDCVEYRFDGDSDKFDETAEKYGFTLSAAKQAALLEYKREKLRSAYKATETEKAAYYSDAYVRVRLIYAIRPDEDSAAYANYEALVEEMRAAASAVSDTAFTDMVSSSMNPDAGYTEYPGGYYFSELDKFTIQYREYADEVVDAVFSIDKVGGYVEATVHIEDEASGVDETRTYFIRRYELGDLATARMTYGEVFFENFDRFANDTAFAKWRDGYLDEAQWDEDNIPTWDIHVSHEDLMKFFSSVR